jgi:NitT/TauT family transport system permease protein
VSSAPLAVGPVPRGTVQLVGRRVLDWVPALVVLVAGIGGWEGLVRALHVQRFLLPAPSKIATTLWADWDPIWSAGWFTFQEALGGFAMGASAAILLAVVVTRWPALGEALLPYAIAASAVPIIAFSPITNAWFNPLTKTSKMAIAAVLCFFPVFVNLARGLRSVRPQQLELMRSYAAGELEVFRRVRVPTALPLLFAGLKVASVLAMIGAIVGEYFGGSLDSLGARILQDSSLFRFELAWAEIVVACVFGIAFYLAVAGVERLVTRWQPPGDSLSD